MKGKIKRVLVIGASGMVGSRFVELASGSFSITPVDEKTLDVTDAEAVKKYFKDNHNFDAVLNFSAYTNVDGAEVYKNDKSGLVWQLNVEAPRTLSRICKERNFFFVHISTDYVFPGVDANPGPYDEDAPPPKDDSNMGWYGWTKNRAEKVVIESGVRIAIVRLCYAFRATHYEKKLDWARTLINLYEENRLYPLFTDQIQSITFIDDLVDPLTKIVTDELTGTFHIASNNTGTPFEMGRYILEKYTGKLVEIKGGLLSDFMKIPGKSPRPKLGGLQVKKTEDKLGITFRTWQEMLNDFVAMSRYLQTAY